MPDQERPDSPSRKKRDREPLKPVLIIFGVIILMLAAAGIFFLPGPEEEKTDIPLSEPLSSEPPVIVEKTETPEPPRSEKPLVGQEALPAGVEKKEPAEVIIPGPEPVSPEERKADECRILAEQIHDFFTHIDSEDYIKPFALQEPSQSYFIALARKLLANPPVVSRESDDLYTILRNMAHFFRIIGKENIVLIKTILDRERDKIEDVAAQFYQWTTMDSCNDDLLQFSPSLGDMYEYAGFFLNTMGGRSYLFRRDSRSRLLVNYYSVLLIERANQRGINRHGIDIIQAIPQLIQEIDASNQLIYKENYIDNLYTLLEKYQ